MTCCFIQVTRSNTNISIKTNCVKVKSVQYFFYRPEHKIPQYVLHSDNKRSVFSRISHIFIRYDIFKNKKRNIEMPLQLKYFVIFL